MEEQIKNFDRTIEHIMNESAVAPPYGMWNRISAELDKEALPAAAAAPASAIPKRAIVTAAATLFLVATSVLTVFLLNKTPANEIKSGTALTTPFETKIPAGVADRTPENKAVTHAVVSGKEKEITISKHQVSEIERRAPVTLPVESMVSTPQTEVAIPINPASNAIRANSETYFFPPVDANIPDSKSAIALATQSDDDETAETDETGITERKTKSSFSREKKIKFRKKRTPGFSYGTLNRTRQNRSR